MAKMNSDLPLLSEEEREHRLLTTAGFAARAGKAIFGASMVTEALRSGKVLLVLAASDNSPATQKRIGDKTSYYGVTLKVLQSDGAALAHAFGKRDGKLAAVGITDAGIARSCEKYL